MHDRKILAELNRKRAEWLRRNRRPRQDDIWPRERPDFDGSVRHGDWKSDMTLKEKVEYEGRAFYHVTDDELNRIRKSTADASPKRYCGISHGDDGQCDAAPEYVGSRAKPLTFLDECACSYTRPVSRSKNVGYAKDGVIEIRLDGASSRRQGWGRNFE